MFGAETRLTSTEIAALKVIHIGRVDAPVVASTVARLAHLHKALVEREVVANAVPPALVRATLVVGVVRDHVVVDLVEQDLAVVLAQDGHRDESDVGVLGAVVVSTATTTTTRLLLLMLLMLLQMLAL